MNIREQIDELADSEFPEDREAAAVMEKMQAVVDAVKPLYASGTHLYDCDIALGKALAELDKT